MVNVAGRLNLPFLGAELQRLERGAPGVGHSTDPSCRRWRDTWVGAGGKRLRPALALALASTVADGASVDRRGRAGGHLGRIGASRVAVPRRRDGRGGRPPGRASVNARWGNLVAILAGDFLLARACIVRSTSGVAEGLAVARRFADVAAAALDPVEETVARSLAGLAHSLLGDVTGA